MTTSKAKHILIIEGHTSSHHFTSALAESYAQQAIKNGHTVRTIQLSALTFDPILKIQGPAGDGTQHVMPLEPDLRKAQEDILWANHIVLVFPIWWGGLPALLKGFFDRILQSGFAFRYVDGGSRWEKLLQGKSADIVITMDTPRWIYSWLYGGPVIRQLRYTILGFCGIKTSKILYCAGVVRSKPAQRSAWLQRAADLAARL